MLEFETKEFKINSPELQSLINNNWVTANASLGTPESKVSSYIKSFISCFSLYFSTNFSNSV